MKIISASSHPDLSKKISKHLDIPLVKCKTQQFSNSEFNIQIDENLRNDDIVIIGTGSFTKKRSVSDHVWEILLMIDACKRASCKKVTVVLPCFPYARQDKKDAPRVPISAAVVTKQLTTAGLDHLISLDLHAAQIQGFIDKPFDNLYAIKYLTKHLVENIFQVDISTKNINDHLKNMSKDELKPRINLIKEMFHKEGKIYNDSDIQSELHNQLYRELRNNKIKELDIDKKYILVSPDNGGAKRIDAYAADLLLERCVMNKKRDYTKSSTVLKSELHGVDDCKNRTAIVIDDMMDTMGTMSKACEVLLEKGFKDVIIMATHGIFSGPAMTRINECDAISKVIVTNSVPQKNNKRKCSKLEVVDISPLMADVIKIVHNGGSISKLFK